jgi:SAM-dependent methyltransferase
VSAGNPFQDPGSVRELYRSARRQQLRTGALMAAKVRGADVGDVLVQLARRHAVPRPRLLEVGGGRGGTMARLAAELSPVRAVALDGSPALLAALRARAGAAVETVLGDFHALPFPAGGFDLVVAAFCLYHSPAPERVCAQLARCLAPGGVALLVTKSLDSYAALDRLVAASGADPGASGSASLYASFHSGNVVDVATGALAPLELRHDANAFRFGSAADAADYAATVPKYRNCGDPRRLAQAFEAVWPQDGLTLRSTVSYLAAARR